MPSSLDLIELFTHRQAYNTVIRFKWQIFSSGPFAAPYDDGMYTLASNDLYH